MRKSLEFDIDNEPQFIIKLINWGAQFDHISFLNSNQNTGQDVRNLHYPLYNFLCAVGMNSEVRAHAGNAFELLKDFYNATNDWLFGHFSYDLKNEIEQLSSQNSSLHKFPDIYFFQPRYLFLFQDKRLKISYLTECDKEESIQELFHSISSFSAINSKEEADKSSTIYSKVSKQDYLNKVKKIKQHIQLGDIYEMNYCVEFYADGVRKSPVQMYLELNALGLTPFSCFYKLNSNYLLCASPERFLKKQGQKLISQPIKGTRKRGFNKLEDLDLIKDLYSDEKERSENVMIVDLVRNDLSRSAVKGSVQVEELFGIYTFKQVHQMISSISSELKKEVHPIDAIKYAFPMGSMTGAPKVRAMQLIDEMETSKRGLYSGAIGYFTPEGDFDFNVVIRSILYNEELNYASFLVGSAITANSDEHKEYDECLLKAAGMLEVLGDKLKL